MNKDRAKPRNSGQEFPEGKIGTACEHREVKTNKNVAFSEAPQ